MAAIPHPCPDVLPTRRMIELQTTIQPVAPAGKKGGVMARITPAPAWDARPTTKVMQATKSLKTAPLTPMTSLATMARVLWKQHST